MAIDLEVLKIILLTRFPALNSFFIAVTQSIELVIFFIPISFLGYGILVKSEIVRQKAIFIICSVLLSATLTTVLKHIVDKQRPFISDPTIQNLVNAGSPSFPSGHTSDAFVLATAICLAFPKRLIIFPIFLWAILVGYSRMYLGVHYPSDVLAGAILGACSALFVWKIFLRKWVL